MSLPALAATSLLLASCSWMEFRYAASIRAASPDVRVLAPASSANVFSIEGAADCLVWNVGYPDDDPVRTTSVESGRQLASIELGIGYVVPGVNSSGSRVLVATGNNEYTALELPGLRNGVSFVAGPSDRDGIDFPVAVQASLIDDGWLVFLHDGWIGMFDGSPRPTATWVRPSVAGTAGVVSVSVDRRRARAGLLHNDGRIEVIDLRSPSVVASLPAASGRRRALVLRDDLVFVTGIDGTGYLSAIDMTLGAELGRIDLGSVSRAWVCGSADGRWLAVATSSRSSPSSSSVVTLSLRAQASALGSPVACTEFSSDVPVESIAFTRRGDPEVVAVGDRGLAVSWSPREPGE